MRKLEDYQIFSYLYFHHIFEKINDNSFLQCDKIFKNKIVISLETWISWVIFISKKKLCVSFYISKIKSFAAGLHVYNWLYSLNLGLHWFKIER